MPSAARYGCGAGLRHNEQTCHNFAMELATQARLKSPLELRETSTSSRAPRDLNLHRSRRSCSLARARPGPTRSARARRAAPQRVWDYAGDNYVHRLIQNKVDGKLVELPAAGSQGALSRQEGENEDTRAQREEMEEVFGGEQELQAR